MGSEEPIEAVAERWRRKTDPAVYSESDLMFEVPQRRLADLERLANAMVARLAADRSEAAERAKPIDAEWCLANGARHWKAGDEYVFDDCKVRWGVNHGPGETLRGGVSIESTSEVSQQRAVVSLPSITTRGQLLDLLRALKGGE